MFKFVSNGRMTMPKHLSVTVAIDGEPILTIETNCVAGKSNLTNEDEDAIRLAAAHLLSFVGAADAGAFNPDT
jgi:hypothetical protein